MAVKQAYGNLRPFYVYDPNVGDELGGLRVIETDKGKHVLANPTGVQYWIDQGLLGDKPLSEVTGNGRKVLDQITRGRTVDNDVDPARLPKYSKATQSGANAYAGKPSEVKRAKKRKDRQKDNGKKQPEPKAAQQPAPATGTKGKEPTPQPTPRTREGL